MHVLPMAILNRPNASCAWRNLFQNLVFELFSKNWLIIKRKSNVAEGRFGYADKE